MSDQHHKRHIHHNGGGTQAAEAARGPLKDPVCGMMVDPRTTPHRYELGNSTYHFCSAGLVGPQPRPDTYAFWTFGALGLMVGFVLTYPVNWWLVAIGWKHGQGMEHMLKEMEQGHGGS